MDKGEFRKTIISNLISLLKNNQPLSTFNITQIQESFSSRKTSQQKSASQNNEKLARKVYGINYRCIADGEEFHYSNNIKTLTLAIMEIAFRDFYTASLLVAELKQNTEHLKNIQNFPLQSICPPTEYPALITETFLQLCEICQQRIDLPLRDIMSLSHFGLQMISMILRSILIKMHYPNSENYLIQQTNRNTHEIFTIICEYLDIAIIANITKNSQVYLFTDYNIFIATTDNEEFICGKYFQNEQALRATDEIDCLEVEMLLRLRELDEEEPQHKQTQKQQNKQQFQLELRESGIQFAFPQNNINSLDPYTPEFKQLQAQHFKIKKYDKEHPDVKAKFSMIKQQPEGLQGSVQISRQQIEERLKKIQEEEEITKAPRSSEQNGFKKPPSLTLAGVAQLKIIKNRGKKSQEKKRSTTSKEEQNFQGISPISKNKEILDFGDAKNHEFIPSLSNITAQDLLIEMQEQIKEFNDSDSKKRSYKGSFNLTVTNKSTSMKRIKQSQILKQTSKSPKSNHTPLDSILDRIKKKNQEIKAKLITKQAKPKQELENKEKSENQNQLKQKSLSIRQETQARVYEPPLKTHKTELHRALPTTPKPNRDKLQDKFRKYSENRVIKNTQKSGKKKSELQSPKNMLYDFNQLYKSSKKSNYEELSSSNKLLKHHNELLNIELGSKRSFKATGDRIKAKSPETYRSSKKMEGDKNCHLILNKKNSKPVNKIPEFLRNKINEKQKSNLEGLKSSEEIPSASNCKFPYQFHQTSKMKLSPRDHQHHLENNHQLSHIPLNKDILLKKCKNTQSFPLFSPQNKLTEQTKKTSKGLQNSNPSSFYQTDQKMAQPQKYERNCQITNIQGSSHASGQALKNHQNFPKYEPPTREDSKNYSKYLHGSMYRSSGNLQPLYYTNPEFTRHTYYHPQDSRNQHVNGTSMKKSQVKQIVPNRQYYDNRKH